MIKSIRDKDTQKVMDDIKPKKFSKELCRIARRKLKMVDSASMINGESASVGKMETASM